MTDPTVSIVRAVFGLNLKNVMVNTENLPLAGSGEVTEAPRG